MKICCLQTIFEEHCDSLKSIFRLLHNEKRAVHNITVYCEERYAERKNKEKLCYTDFQETDFRVLAQGGKILCSCMDSRILLRKTRRIKMMKINGFNGTNTQTGAMGMAQANDSVSKNIQNQIANAQQKLQDLSSNEELSLEDKMKKRQEIQQEITNLNQQLRQHQIEQRKEQQSKKSSMDDIVAGTKNTSAKKGTGLSQAGMRAMISADSSMKQAKVQGSMATQMEGRAGVLESEIKQDAGKGNTEKKEEELADLQAKAQSATASQMSSLSDANKSMEEAVKADNSTDAAETKKNQAQKEENTQENVDTTTDASDNADIKTETAETIKNPASESGQSVVYTPIDIRL